MLRDFPAELIEMGFPTQHKSEVEILSAVTHEFCKEGYQCPRCKAMLQELPSTCPICRLSCVASPHLARSFHHLFPVPLFEKVSIRPKLAATGEDAEGDDAAADEDAATAPETQEGAEGGAASKNATLAAQCRTCSGCSRCIRPEELCFRCPRENDHQTLDSQGTPAANAGTRRSGIDEAVYCMECDIFIHDVLHNTPPPVSAAMLRRLESATQRAGEEKLLVKVKREREEQD
jgi:transcription initiation factor TFIIH subunit 2